MEHIVDRLLEIVAEHQSRDTYLTDKGIFFNGDLLTFERLHGYKPEVFNREQFMSMSTDRKENMIKAIRIIPFVVRRTSSKCLVNSYGLKHVLEKHFSDSYICTGDVVLCMLYLGYKMKLTRNYIGWNAMFGCDYVKNDAGDPPPFLKF